MGNRCAVRRGLWWVFFLVSHEVEDSSVQSFLLRGYIDGPAVTASVSYRFRPGVAGPGFN